MDIISKAMDKGLHICENINVEKQTWELFESNREGKQVFVFGTGGGLGYFLRNCSQDMDIVGVIDNDKNKQGQKLGWCSGDAEQTKYAELLIQSPDILNTYSSKGIVVLITSVNVYLPIVAQLEVMGIENYYILLMLEANRRKDLGCEAEENDEKIRNFCFNSLCSAHCHYDSRSGDLCSRIRTRGDNVSAGRNQGADFCESNHFRNAYH